MRRAVVTAAAASALLLAGSGLLQAAPPAPTRIQVAAREYSFVLSRLRVKAGPAIVELVNMGEDAHDLALRRVGPGARTLHIPVVQPGALRRISVTLRPGRYAVWCTVTDHRSLGMSTRLVVR